MQKLHRTAAAAVPKPKFKLSIRTILIAVIVIMVSMPVIVSTYLSYRYGARSSSGLVKKTADMINANIQKEIADYFAQPVDINNMNENLILDNLLDEKNQASLMSYFCAQIKTCENVSSIYFANPEGGLANAGIDKATNQYYVIYTDKFQRGAFRKYAIDSNGEKTELISHLPDFDARTRPWYKNAIANPGVVFSDTYLVATGNNLGINVSKAVRDKDKQLLGVVCVDLFLSDISKFLAQLEHGHGGKTFIMDKTGLLIATSSDAKLFTLESKTQNYTRVNALLSESGLISATSTQLKLKYSDFKDIARNTNLDLNIEDEPYLVQVKPFNASENQEWLIVTAIPKSTYMAQVYANNKSIIYIMTLILLISILLAVLVAKLISHPILSLDKKIRAISQGDWSLEPIPSRVLEIDDLAVEIYQMKTTLKSNFEALSSEIAERKQAEILLRDSEKRYRGLLTNLDAGVIVHAPDTSIMISNSKAADLLGLSNDQLRGVLASDPGWRFIDENGIPICIEDYPVNQIIRNRQAIKDFVLGSSRSANSDIVWLTVNGFPAFDKNGEISEVVVSFIDITERKLAEKENARIQEQLNQSHKMELLGQLAGGVAHDFNNLLTVIMGYSSELSNNLPAQSQFQNDAEEIYKAGGRAKGLTQQLLTFSRKQVLQAKVLDLNVLIANLQGTFFRLIGEHIEFLCLLSQERAMVKADQGQIEQIIINLVLNSRDAMPKGGKITISTEILDAAGAALQSQYQIPSGQYVLLSVADTGQGMPKSVLNKIFEPFFTTKDKGKGLGLGLSTVYGIVLQSGGHIFVDSEEGTGTTVKVLLPFTKESPDFEPSTNIGEEFCGKGEQILIVEDEESLATLVQKMVSKLGYKVAVSNFGADAISKIAKGFKPDLIITDVVMPGMNGKELADQVRQLVPDQKVLFMSGFTDNIIEPHGVLESGIPFIQKPFSASEIAVKIKALLSATAEAN